MKNSGELEKGKESNQAVEDVNQSEFEKKVVKRSEEVSVVVDFWASWCKPCKELSPRLESLTENCENEFVLAKVNIENNHRIVQEQGVRSVPTVKLYRGGEEVDQLVGSPSESRLKDWLKENLKG